MLIKPFDWGIIIPLLGAVIVSFFWVYTGTDSRAMIKLKGAGGEWIFPADADETIVVSGPIGDTVIRIHGDETRVISSPCINQSCVAAGAIHLPGQWSACLPNHVMVYIDKGATANDTDAAAW